MLKLDLLVLATSCVFLFPPIPVKPQKFLFGSPSDGVQRFKREADRDENENSVEQQQQQQIVTVRLRNITKKAHYDEEDGHIVALEGGDIELYLYGRGFSEDSKVRLTTHRAEFGNSCHGDGEESRFLSKTFRLKQVTPGRTRAILSIPGDEVYLPRRQNLVFFCLGREDGETFVHQGTETDAVVEIAKPLLPLSLMIVFIVILLCMSGLFSGLNLGLMALDQTELKVVQNTGTKSERSFANKIAPIRSHGNFLLCSLLLGNVLVNSSLTVLIDSLSTGTIAIVGSTLGIVIFGEIIPQAICSRHGLAVGAYTIWLTKFFMLVTFPLSYPISIILDKVLGAEIGTVYDKKKLIELLRVTNENNDLEKEEVDIVTGALVYKDKTVKDIMTTVEDIYMLPLEAVLDFDTVSEIREQGYSRIPVYHSERKNIVHVLFAKDLMFVDPDDRMPLTTVCQFYRNNVNFVFQDTPLNVMFNEFKSGDKGHMAFVQEINTEGEGDPFYETTGLVTLEDIIEEIIQQEIVDETDIVADNRTKRRLKREGRKGKGGSFTLLNPQQDERLRRVAISPQLALAVFQYLTTSVEPFKAPVMHDFVLKKLLSVDVYREIKVKKDRAKMKQEDITIIRKGKKVDFFILIIEGRVEVNVGREELIFESGPFTFFGIQVLNDLMAESPSYTQPAPSLSLSADHKAHTTPSAIADKNVEPPKTALRKANTQDPLQSPGLFLKSNVHRRGTKSGRVARKDPFVPDYTVKAASDVLYLQIKEGTYSAALKASEMHNASDSIKDQREIDSLLMRSAYEGEDVEGADKMELSPILMWVDPSASQTGALQDGGEDGMPEDAAENDDEEEGREEVEDVHRAVARQGEDGGDGSGTCETTSLLPATSSTTTQNAPLPTNTASGTDERKFEQES